MEFGELVIEAFTILWPCCQKRVHMARRIYIIEPHPAVRESFFFLVGPMANLTVVGSASSYEAAACDLAQEQPDIVLMGLAGASDAPIRWLRAQCPDARILVASAFQTGLTPSVAQAAGADICVSRAHGAPSLLPSLRKLVNVLNPSGLRPVDRDAAASDTPRMPPCAAESARPASIDSMHGMD